MTIYAISYGSPDLRRFPSEINFSGEKSVNINLEHDYIVWGVQIWDVFRLLYRQFKSRTWLYGESRFETFSVWNKFFRWKVGQYKSRTWLYTLYRIGESRFETFSVWNNFFRWKVGQYKYRTWVYTLYRMGSPHLSRFPSEITFSGEKSVNINIGHDYIRYIVWGVQIWDVFRLK